MARRRAKPKTRRRRKQGISIIGVAETVALSNVATQTLFNINAWDFLTATHRSDGSYGMANVLTLREIMKPQQTTGYQQSVQGGRLTSTATTQSTFSIVKSNLDENWMSGAISMVTIPLAFRIGKKLGAPAINKVNALLRKAGVASTVKV